MNRLNIFGCSWNQMDLLFDLAFETHGIKDFRIYQNIPAEMEEIIPMEGNYRFSVIEPGEHADPGADPLLFGVTGPRAKVAVLDFLKKVYNREEDDLVNLIHPSSYLASSVHMGQGIIIEPKVILSSQARIGFGVSIKRGASIGHHSEIGDFTEINPGVIIPGKVKIGRGCIIGVGAVLKNGVSIGNNSYIGMGSVVMQDIPDGVIAYGNPCKVVRENEKWKI